MYDIFCDLFNKPAYSKNRSFFTLNFSVPLVFVEVLIFFVSQRQTKISQLRLRLHFYFSYSYTQARLFFNSSL